MRERCWQFLACQLTHLLTGGRCCDVEEFQLKERTLSWQYRQTLLIFSHRIETELCLLRKMEERTVLTFSWGRASSNISTQHKVVGFVVIRDITGC